MADSEDLHLRIKELEGSELRLKKAEERLKRERSVLDSIIHLNPYAISIYDAGGRYLRGNRAFAELFGSVPPPDYSIFTDPVLEKEGHLPEREKLERGEVVRVPEVWYNPGLVRPEMPDRYILVKGIVSPIMDAEGRLDGVVIMHEDITERRLAEEALRESEEKFSRAFEGNPGPIAISELTTGRFVDVNERLLELSGYTREEVIGKTSLEVGLWKNPGDRERLVAALGERGSVRDMEVEFRAKGGEIKDTLVSAQAIEVAGEPLMLAIVTDVTEQKRIRRELVRERDFSDSIINSMPGLLYIFDEEGRYHKWNENLERVTGYTTEEVERLHPLDLFAGDDKRKITEGIRRVFGEGEATEEADLVAKDGETTPYYFTGKRIVMGSKTYCCGLGIDISDRKRVEEKLREKREILENILSASPIGIGLAEDRIIKWNNAAWCEMFGFDDPGDYLGRDSSLIYATKEEYDRIGEVLYGALERGEPAETDAKFRRKDGTVFDGHIKLSSLDPAQPKKRVLATFMDISWRKQAHEALKQSEERYRLLLRNLPSIVYRGHLDWAVDFMDNKVETLTGYHMDLFNSRRMKWSDLLVEEDFESAKASFVSALKNDKSFVREYRIKTRSGETTWVQERGQIVCNDRGEVEYVSGVFFDINERKAAEEGLKESEERYKRLSEVTLEGIVFHDHGRLIDSNSAFSRLTGWPREEIIGKDIIEIAVAPEYRDTVRKRIEEGYDKPYEIRGVKKDGTTFPVELEGREVYYKDRTLRVTSIRDITEAKRAESERKRLEDQLRQAQKMEAVGTLAGGIAHDFNNLLQAIRGYADLLLLQEGDAGSGHEELKEITRAAARGRELTRQLLTFSRKVESKRRPIDLNRQVSQMKNMLARTIPKMIRIKLDLAEEPKIVEADEAQIEQVIMNLAVNAKDAMPRGGVLTIATDSVHLDDEYCRANFEATPGDHVVLAISDTGHGMDPKTVEHIFEPFYSTKETGKGTGLGLAIVYGIVKSHGGHVTCTSQRGRGTTFNIYLPLGEYPERLPSREEEPEELPGGSETILLVDDEEFIRNLGKKTLTAFGYTVIVAPDGESAVELYRNFEGRIDLVILDLIMPGMGGGRCLEELVGINPQVKVVIASGYSSEGPDNAAVEKWASGFIGKPYELKQMLAAVRGVLDEG